MDKDTLLFFLNIGKGLALSALPPSLASAIQRVEKEIHAEAKRRKTTIEQLLIDLGGDIEALNKEADATIAKAEKALQSQDSAR